MLEPTSPLFPIVLVSCILTATFVPILTVLIVTRWWLRDKLAKETRQWEREGVIFSKKPAMSNFAGIESQGMIKVRGNGVIALTTEDLRITRAVPAAKWCIPHNHIKAVTLENSFLGKRRGSKVLVITFEKEGYQDRIGVYVGNSLDWANAIKEVANLTR